MSRDTAREAKVPLKLKLDKYVKSYKKVFFSNTNNKLKKKETMKWCFAEVVNYPATNNAEKTEVPNTFFMSIFTTTVGPQALAQYPI